MRLVLLIAWALPALADSPSPSPIAWSPNGRWIAAVSLVPEEAPSVVGPGFLFEEEDGDAPVGFPGRPRAYRLSAIQGEDGAAVRLAEAPGPITGPGWNADGTALAYGQVTRSPEGLPLYQVVIQDAPDRRRVVWSRNVGDNAAEGELLTAQGVAWSPDGRFLAAPTPESLGLVILRAEDGRLLKTIAGARSPSWSPDGVTLVYLGRRGTAGLWAVDAHMGPPQSISAIFVESHPLSWSRDSRSFLVLRRRGQAEKAPGLLEIARIQLDDGRVETFRALSPEVPRPNGGGLRSASFTADPDLENLFVLAEAAGQPNAVTWLRTRRNEVQSRFNSFDFSIAWSALALSPSGQQLAFRLGSDDTFGPVGLHDLEGGKMTPLAADADDRDRWLGHYLRTMALIIRHRYPGPKVGDQPAGRPTILPIPGEVAPNAESALVLRRLARQAALLLDTSATSSNTRPTSDTVRLFLAALSGESAEALRILEDVERTARNADERLRLLGLRIQLDLALGHADRARDALDYLRKVRPRPRQRVDESSAGVIRLIDDPDPTDLWLAFLRENSEPLLRSATDPEPDQADPRPMGRLPMDAIFPNDPLLRADEVPPGPRPDPPEARPRDVPRP